jgi:hypothetical protein
MKRAQVTALAAALIAAGGLAPTAWAFNSGSTGELGAFNPTVTTVVPLPPSGILNYTSVTIPVGVTVTFQKNATNTPVTILATGDVLINGTINISGTSAANVGTQGDGALGDDGAPGLGGPGGYDGGRGGLPTGTRLAGQGVGPGAGIGGHFGTSSCNGIAFGGAGGGYGTAGGGFLCVGPNIGITGGQPYGNPQILPLIGGSGGGGGASAASLSGSGGGGGGGAILIAASGTVTINGSILANGGNGGVSNGAGIGASGGGGSGGAIRILATHLAGGPAGVLSAVGGVLGPNASFNGHGTNGGVGRIRLEYETTSRNASAVTNPGPTIPIAGTPPGPVFIAGGPTLRIAQVAGSNAPAAPTGNADITLPSSTSNPVTVMFESSGVPLGSTVFLAVTPAFGPRATAVSTALSGTVENATASASITLPAGPSALFAQTTFTVVASIGELLKNFAGNERVEKVTLMASLGGPAKALLITVSGKEYEVPAEVLRLTALGG